MEPATILLTIPKKANDATFYTSIWAEKMLRLATSLSYKVVVLKGDNTTYRKVTQAFEKYRPRLYVHVGHGCQSHLNGQNECIATRKIPIDELMMMEPEKIDKLLNPVKLGGCDITGLNNTCSLEGDVCRPICFNETNIHLLKGSIIYATACHSAEILGKCSIKYGVQSYVGYSDLLLFPVDPMRSQDIFGEVHLEFLKYLLEGYSVKEAYDSMMQMEDAYIRLYKKTKWVGLPLMWNHLNRRVLGNPDARIYQ